MFYHSSSFSATTKQSNQIPKIYQHHVFSYYHINLTFFFAIIDTKLLVSTENWQFALLF